MVKSTLLKNSFATITFMGILFVAIMKLDPFAKFRINFLSFQVEILLEYTPPQSHLFSFRYWIFAQNRYLDILKNTGMLKIFL